VRGGELGHLDRGRGSQVEETRRREQTGGDGRNLVYRRWPESFKSGRAMVLTESSTRAVFPPSIEGSTGIFLDVLVGSALTQELGEPPFDLYGEPARRRQLSRHNSRQSRLRARATLTRSCVDDDGARATRPKEGERPCVDDDGDPSVADEGDQLSVFFV
jgi:hypothetical protein